MTDASLITSSRRLLSPVAALRIGIVAAVLGTWEIVAASGLLFRDVVPSLPAIGKALGQLLIDPVYYANLGVTVGELLGALAVGGGLGLAVGMVLGANAYLGKAFEEFLYYLGPTPKIIFFPVMLLWFGIDTGSKVAMGALSCFFPIAVSALSGMRQVDGVLIRVGRSFRASTWQMVTKIYLPAMRHPIVNGLRLGLGVAIIGTLLAETKMSNQGLGFLIIQTYTTFNMPRMYALLITLFLLAIGLNALIAWFSGGGAARKS